MRVRDRGEKGWGRRVYLEALEWRVMLSSTAPSTALPVSNPRDLIFDTKRNQLDIVTPTSIQRFDLATHTFLPSITVGTSLGPGDITPDGSAIYVPSEAPGISRVLYRVDLSTLQVTTISYSGMSSEGPASGLKILSNQTALIGSAIKGPTYGNNVGYYRFFDLNTKTFAPQVSMGLSSTGAYVYRSMDRTAGWIKSPDWVFADMDYAGQSAWQSNISTAVSMVSDIALSPYGAVNPGGMLSAIDLTSGMAIQDHSFFTVQSFPGIEGPVAFDANGNFYLYNASGHDVLEYDPNWQQIGDFAIDASFTPSGSLGVNPMYIPPAGDRLYLLNASGVLAVPINGMIGMTSTTTNLSLGAASVLPGQSVQATVTISGNAWGTVPLFDLNSNTVVGSVVLYAGKGTTTLTLPKGNYQLVAEFGGDADFGWSNSSAVALTVAKPSPSLSMTVTRAGYPTLSPILKVAVSGAQGTPTGTVSLYDGATLIGSGTLTSGSVTINPAVLSIGQHNLQAVYSGNGTYDVGQPSVVAMDVEQVQPTVQVSLLRSLTVTSVPTFNVAISPNFPVSATGTVDLYEGGTLLGQATAWSGSASISTGLLSAGEHTVVVHYVGDANFVSEDSLPLTFTVSMENASAGLSIKAIGRVTTAPTFSIAVSGSKGAPSGVVNLYEGAVQVGSGTLVNGSVQIHPGTAFSMGSHQVFARYEGDAIYGTKDTAAVTFDIEPIVTTTFVTASRGMQTDGGTTTLTATVAMVDGGTVTFYDGATVLGTVTISGDQVTLTTSLSGLGNHTITAQYSGDTDFQASSSATPATVKVVVPTTVSLMVLYTSDLAGTGIDQEILDAVATVNDAMLNSLIPVQIQLVHTQMESYVSSGNYNTDLTRLENTRDGFMDDVAGLRSEWQADLVSLFVGQADNTNPKSTVIGLGEELRSTAGNIAAAFSVVYASDAGSSGEYTLAHELGHNFGASHDAANDPSKNVAFPTGEGWRFWGNDNQLYHDIMSYTPGAAIPYYSNPAVSYWGQPTGTSTADAADVIAKTAPLVALYHTKLPATTVPHAPVGAIESVNGRTVTGYGYDRNAGAAGVRVRVDLDGVAGVPMVAGGVRNDLVGTLGSANHGWTYSLPANLADGSHTLDLWVQDYPGTSWVKVDSQTITTDFRPDLTVSLGVNSPNYATYVPGDWVTVPVTVKNVGVRSAVGTAGAPIKVEVRLSSDNTFDGGDTLVQTLSLPYAIVGGGTVALYARFQVPVTVEGSYFVVAEVDTTGVVNESNEGNNAAVRPGVVVEWQFGRVAGRVGSVPLSFHDADGTLVTLMLGGPGTGTLRQATDGGWELTLSGTTLSSALTITTVKSTTPGDDGRFTVENVYVGQDLGIISARTTNVGQLMVEGAARSVSLGNVGANGITIEPVTPVPLVLSVDQVQGATITSTSTITSLTVTDWQGGGLLQAPAVTRLTVTGDRTRGLAGDFNTDMDLNDGGSLAANATLLGAVTVAGSIGAYGWSLNHGGKIGTMSVAGTLAGWMLESAGDMGSMVLGIVSNVEIGQGSAVGKIGPITAKAWNGGSIHAASIGAVRVTGAAGIDGNFNPDMTLDGVSGSTLPTLGSVTAPQYVGGRWTVAGGIGAITGKWANYLTIEADDAGSNKGNIASVVMTDAILPSTLFLTANAITTLTISADLEYSSVTLRQGVSPTARALTGLTVRGTLLSTQIHSVGNIGAVTMGSMNHSGIYVGLPDGWSGLPTKATDFSSVQAGTISALYLTGIKTDPSGGGLGDSYIAAGTITSVVLPNRVTAIGDDGVSGKFGFATLGSAVKSYVGPVSAGNYVSGKDSMVS